MKTAICISCAAELRSGNIDRGICDPCLNKKDVPIFLNWKVGAIYRTREEAEKDDSVKESDRNSILHVQMSAMAIAVLNSSLYIFTDLKLRHDKLCQELVEIGMGQHRVGNN